MYISSDTEDAVTKSCESAVDIIAARIPHRKIPATNGNAYCFVNKCVIILMNTFSAESAPALPSTSGYRYALPTTPMMQAKVKDNATQTIAIPLDLFNSFWLFTAINLVRI